MGMVHLYHFILTLLPEKKILNVRKWIFIYHALILWEGNPQLQRMTLNNSRWSMILSLKCNTWNINLRQRFKFASKLSDIIVSSHLFFIILMFFCAFFLLAWFSQHTQTHMIRTIHTVKSMFPYGLTLAFNQTKEKYQRSTRWGPLPAAILTYPKLNFLTFRQYLKCFLKKFNFLFRGGLDKWV